MSRDKQFPDSAELIRQAREQRTRDLMRAVYGEKAWLWRQRPDLALLVFDDFVAWLDDVGFAPQTRRLLPSAREATLGRSYDGGSAWMRGWGDESMERLWTWKDRLGAERRGYYGAGPLPHLSLVSLSLLPEMLALTPSIRRMGSLFDDGTLSRDANSLYDALTEHGALSRNALRRLSGLSGVRLGRSLRESETSGLIVRVGVAEEGSGWPATIYATFEEAYPEIVAEAAKIEPEEARGRILSVYDQLAPEAAIMQVATALGWPRALVEATREK